MRFNQLHISGYRDDRGISWIGFMWPPTGQIVKTQIEPIDCRDDKYLRGLLTEVGAQFARRRANG